LEAAFAADFSEALFLIARHPIRVRVRVRVEVRVSA